MEIWIGPTRSTLRVLLIISLATLTLAKIFSLEPKDSFVSLDVNANTTLSCKAKLTDVTYSWIKDNEHISNEGQNGVLTLPGLIKSDTGNYQCLASNEQGIALSNKASVTTKFFRPFSNKTQTPVRTQEGVGVKLTCNGTNFSPENSVHFSWERKLNFKRFEYPGTAEYYVSQTDGTLYLSNPTLADSDLYTCRITSKISFFNSAKEYNSPGVNLTVAGEIKEHGPTILLLPKEITQAEAGENVTLHFFASGNPTPTITWKKVVGRLPVNHVITSAGQLELYDVTKDMAGIYVCIATNKLGSITTTGSLGVIEKPTWLTKIDSQNTKLGARTRYTCQATGIPPPTYRWLKNSEPLNVTSRVSLSVGTEGGSVMTITEVKERDLAIYQCVAENPYGSLYSNGKLSLKDKGPRFVSEVEYRVLKHSSISLEETVKDPNLLLAAPDQGAIIGYDVILKSTLQGWPRPRIKWEKNGVRITKNFTTTSNGTLTNGWLLIESTSKVDQKIYKCVAENSKGKVTSSRRLLVFDNPSWYISLYSRKVLFGGKVRFRAEAVGIPPPTYKWLKNGKPINMTSRVSVSVRKKGGSVMTIAEVDEDDVALYQCVSQNVAGNITTNAKLRIRAKKPLIISMVYLRAPSSSNMNLADAIANQSMLVESPLDGGVVHSVVIIRATVEGYPRPVISWTKNGVQIADNSTTTYNGTFTNGWLLINTSKSDEGNYSFTATNYKGRATSSAKMFNVYEPTMVEALNSSVVAAAGHNATLQCKVTNDQRLNVSWRWFYSGYKGEITVLNASLGTLQLENVRNDQNGFYKCCATSPIDESCALTFLFLKGNYRLLFLCLVILGCLAPFILILVLVILFCCGCCCCCKRKSRRGKYSTEADRKASLVEELKHSSLVLAVTPNLQEEVQQEKNEEEVNKLLLTSAVAKSLVEDEQKNEQQEVKEGLMIPASLEVSRTEDDGSFEESFEEDDELSEEPEIPLVIPTSTSSAEDDDQGSLMENEDPLLEKSATIQDEVLGTREDDEISQEDSTLVELDLPLDVAVAQSFSATLDDFSEGITFDHPLIRQYVTLVEEKKYKEANRVADDLQALVQGQISSENLLKMAGDCRDKNMYLESILMLQISPAPESDQDPRTSAILEVSKKMIENNQEEVVVDHVLPLLMKMSEAIEEEQIDKEVDLEIKSRVLRRVWILRDIEKLQGRLGDLESRERTLRKAILLMEEAFVPVEASKHRVYAYCLNNLGFVCSKTSRIQDAVECYERSLEACRRAEDLSEEERKNEIEKTEKNLRKCQEKLVV